MCVGSQFAEEKTLAAFTTVVRLVAKAPWFAGAVQSRHLALVRHGFLPQMSHGAWWPSRIFGQELAANY